LCFLFYFISLIYIYNFSSCLPFPISWIHNVFFQYATESVKVIDTNTITATRSCSNSGKLELLQYVAHLLNTHEEFIDTFCAQSLGNMAWGVAKLLSLQQQQQQQLASIYSNNSNSDTISIINPTMTILRHIANKFADILTSQQEQRHPVRFFDAQSISNILWALATVEFGVIRTSNENNSINIDDIENNDNINYYFDDEYNTLNPATTTQNDNDDNDDVKLMERVLKLATINAIQIFPSLINQHLVNITSAIRFYYSKETIQFNELDKLLRMIGQRLVTVPPTSIDRSVVDWTHQGISNMIWNLCVLNFVDYNIYQGIAKRIQRIDPTQFDQSHLTKIVWSLSKGDLILKQRKQEELFRNDDSIRYCFDIVAQRVINHPDTFTPVGIVRVLQSFSSIGLCHPTLFNFVAEYLNDIDRKINDNDITSYKGIRILPENKLSDLLW
jgi:hypothetical protein